MDGWCVVSGFYYRRFYGDWFPFLRFVCPEGVGSFVLWGFHFFRFGGRRCWMCGLRPVETGLGLCRACYFSFRGYRYRAVVEGVDRVFGEGVEEFLGDLLSRRYVLYVGVFGSLYKVGIAAFDRFGVRRGFVFRLVEQGFDAAVVFDLGLNLVGAQELERDVVDTFGLRDRLGFFDKIGVIHEEPDFQEFRGLVDDVSDFVGADPFWEGVFSWSGFVDFDSVFRGDSFVGSFVFRRGNVGVARNCGEVLAVNFNDFVGRVLVDSEV